MCAAVSEAEFAALLDYLKNNRGFDFTGYKPSTLYRRIRKRMQNVNVGSFPEYADNLEVHPEEFAFLFNTDMWGLRAEQVLGKPLVSLAIGLPVRELETPLRAVFSGDLASQETTLEAVNRRGKSIRCRLTFTLRRDWTGGPNGLVLLMEEVQD